MKWPDEVTEWLKANVPGRTTKEVVELINRQGFDEKYNMVFTDGLIKGAKARYGIKSGTSRGTSKGAPSKEYPKEIKDYIHANYKGVGPKEMMERLNTLYGTDYTRTSVKAYYRNHKLNSGTDGRWKKGDTPHNKGKKMSQEQYEKCKGTMFKKGHVPANKMKVGEYTHTSNGYLMRKVSEKGVQRERFEFVQRATWEKHHGPIPEGKMIIFLDGNKDNCDISNLAMVDNEENLILNRRKLRKTDAELTKAGVTVAKLRAKAKRRMTENDVSKTKKAQKN